MRAAAGFAGGERFGGAFFFARLAAVGTLVFFGVVRVFRAVAAAFAFFFAGLFARVVLRRAGMATDYAQ